MLTNLSIQNYALIDDVNVSFSSGFTTITGETGAGKSILLGGLSLVLGKRADLSSLKNESQKCIIEAEFEISKYQLRSFFDEKDLDYEDGTILRREILPSGKSRAFVNDSPVTLDILKGLGERLVDVHSQHQTLRLTDNDFQLKVVDALAENSENLKKYSTQLNSYKLVAKELQELLDFQSNSNKEHDYNSFLLQELESAPLKEGIQEALEEECEELNNVEQIMEQLSSADQLINDEQLGILGRLADLKRAFSTLADFGSSYTAINERVQSLFIEMDDIASELENLRQNVEANPQRLEVVNTQLQQLYNLQKKHQVASVIELIEIKKDLSNKVDAVENIDAKIKEKEEEVVKATHLAEELALRIRKSRNTVIPKLKSMLQESLYALGMPSATFKIEVNPSSIFKSNGKDDLVFLFSANKGSDYGELKKVASGGELSRIMLTIKSILAEYEQLPTMMFDEIDTGVSGEISNRMGEIMQQMSKTMQVFSITHLPQVASKGVHQFKVFKEEDAGSTTTQMRKLSDEERVKELAEMLGGKSISESALAHARQLLQ
ncbi:DNA repair protein RecN [Flagellimonas sp. HMM57]|uniref:DNA repair protein RecN n=1 Tax=unclassified Flagellimonas TaxID=2644544 RepID=UPI0013D31334|nr:MULTISPECIES: DNA repair protein RecN [unclassified Flagellimonas]UII75597.1 DNA repair protein RecN [Flagellimonas sp. HMM57]